jgi:hypothetical protein
MSNPASTMVIEGPPVLLLLLASAESPAERTEVP